jgi:hypothetical protein
VASSPRDDFYRRIKGEETGVSGERWKAVQRGAVVAAVVLTAAAVAFVFVQVGGSGPEPEASEKARAAEPDDAPRSARAGASIPGRRPSLPRPRGALYAADPDALRPEDQSPGERAEVAKIRAWAEGSHGPEVHQAWRDATRAGMDRLRVLQAARAAGLEGIATLGVAP